MNIMAWNYRVMIKEGFDGDSSFGIHEVYYDDNDNVIGYSINPAVPLGESEKELKKNLTLMVEALKKPPIPWEESKAVDAD